MRPVQCESGGGSRLGWTQLALRVAACLQCMCPGGLRFVCRLEGNAMPPSERAGVNHGFVTKLHSATLYTEPGIKLFLTSQSEFLTRRDQLSIPF